MLLKSTHYYNAFLNDDGVPFIESKGLSEEEAYDDINDTTQVYAYSLIVEDGASVYMDIAEGARIRKDLQNARADLERLTGHEMGVASGRV